MSTDNLRWMWSILLGLGKAATTDVSVFLLALAGILLGGRKGLGSSLLLYIVLRRADEYGHLYASKMNQIAQVIHEGSQQPTLWHPHEQDSS